MHRAWLSPRRRGTRGGCRPIWGLMAVLASAALLMTAVATAQQPTGMLLGVVTDALGQPLSAATVRLSSTGLHKTPLLRATAANGSFAFAALAPGTYYVQAAKGQHVSLRRRIRVLDGQTSYLAVPVVDLLRSIRLGPSDAQQQEDFGWVLRSQAMVRPVLRWQEQATDLDDSSRLRGEVSFMAGGDSQALAANGLVSTGFAVEQRLWGESELGFSGDMGMANPGSGGAGSTMQVIFSPAGDDSPERLLVSIRDLPVPLVAHAPDLRVVTFNWADGWHWGDAVQVQYGVMLNTVTLASSFHTVDPYLRMQWRLSSHSHVEYRFAEAVPPVHFGPDYATLADPAPEVTLVGFAPRLEHASHNEIGYYDTLTPDDVIEAAVIADRFANTAITGALPGSADLASGNVLPDSLNNMFSADAGAYGGAGLRVVYDHRFGDAVHATLGWADGMALAPRGASMAAAEAPDDFAAAVVPARRQAWTAKLTATAPVTHTRVVCSYRWLNGASVTSIDPYDDSLGQSDSFANVQLIQPLPSFPFGNRVEAVAEFNNLLAQGYIPVVGADGNLLYLIQAARSFRGGLNFHF